MNAARAARALAVLALGAALGVACSPAQMRTLEQRGPSLLARVACVVLRWTTPEGLARELCATAEEIADFGEEMIAARAAKGPAEVDAGTARAPLVAVAPIAVLEAPRRRPRRRCVGWVTLGGREDGGANDERNDGGTASAPGGAVEGSDDGGTGRLESRAGRGASGDPSR